MKNLMMILVVLFVVFVDPVFAQKAPLNCETETAHILNADTRAIRLQQCMRRNAFLIERNRNVITSDNKSSSKEIASPAERLGEHEAMRVFLDRGFVSSSIKEEADFTVEIRVFTQKRLKCFTTSRYSYRRECYLDPEMVVYVTIKDKNDAQVAVGVGDDKNLRDAMKDAAEDAAKKIKEKGKSIYIFDFS